MQETSNVVQPSSKPMKPADRNAPVKPFAEPPAGPPRPGPGAGFVNPSRGRALEEGRAAYLETLRPVTATAFVYLAQDFGWRSPGSREDFVPGLPGAMACDREIAGQCILATLQTMQATHGSRVHALAAMAVRERVRLAPGASPAFFLAAADLTWSRLAGADGVLDAVRLESFTRLSPSLDMTVIDDDFTARVSEAARDLCLAVDPDMPGRPSIRDVPRFDRFAATSVNEIVAQARSGMEHVSGAPEAWA